MNSKFSIRRLEDLLAVDDRIKFLRSLNLEYIYKEVEVIYEYLFFYIILR